MTTIKTCNDVRNCIKPTKINNNLVCRLTVNRNVFDWLQPYNLSETQSGITGTGFFMSKFNPGPNSNNPSDPNHLFLVTAYHVVENGITIHVQIETLQEPIKADLVCCNPDLDIALIRVSMTQAQQCDLFQSGERGLQMGESDKLIPLANIQAIGFALGAPLQATAGVISGRTPTAIQLDAAVNPGNSGGPVIDDDGRVVGIVVSGIDKAQNVNYAAPIKETVLSFERMLQRRHEKTPICEFCASINAELSKTTESLLKSCSEHCNGCYVSYIHKESCLKNEIEVGDFISHVSTDEFQSPIDRQGRINIPIWPNPVSFDILLSRFTQHRKECEQNITLTVHKKNGRETKQVRVDMQTNLDLFREQHPTFEPVKHILYGGIVFMSLAYGHIRKSVRIRELTLPLMKDPENASNSFIIVTHVHPESPLTQMSKIQTGSIITHINDTPIQTLEDIFDNMYKEEYTLFRLLDSSVCCCTKKEATEADVSVARRLNINMDVQKATVSTPKKKESKSITSRLTQLLSNVL